MDDCFSHPVTGVAGRTILVYDRYSEDCNYTQIYPGTKTRALNISSYNYLGFAQARGGCADAVEESIKRYGIAACGARLEGGSNEFHLFGEALVARFVGMEDALISSMGFATNSTFIPALVGKGSLVISDELNHASIRFGVRTSGAQVRMFKHNDMQSLESLLREVISQGQPKTHRPWKKILLIVEGLYSMEGSLVNLPQIIELKKKYKVKIYQEAGLHRLTESPSSTCLLMKRTLLAPLVLMVAVSAITSISLLDLWMFSWEHSPSRLAPLGVTLLAQNISSTLFVSVDIPACTQRQCRPLSLPRSSRAWPVSWVSLPLRSLLKPL